MSGSSHQFVPLGHRNHTTTGHEDTGGKREDERRQVVDSCFDEGLSGLEVFGRREYFALSDV